MADGETLGLTGKQWAMVGGGGIALYVGYRWYTGRRNAAAATGLAGSTYVPPTVQVQMPTSEPTGSGITSLSQWFSKALGQLGGQPGGISTATFIDQVQAWLGGTCVSSAGQSAIAAAITSLGTPPGYSVPPSLRVCAQPKGTVSGAPPNPPAPTGAPVPGGGPMGEGGAVPSLSPSLAAALQPGERVVASAYDTATKTFLYLTNLGGVYTETATNGQAGGAFYGSYLGLPPAGRQGNRQFSSIVANSDGSYTLIATTGSRYLFGPHATKGETQVA